MVDEKVMVILNSFYSELSKKNDYFKPYLDRNASCEKWIQGEFIHWLYKLRNSGQIQEARLEQNYGPRAGLCDIGFTVNKKEYWCELQVIVTNYGMAGKPITNQVKHVMEDANKLKKNIQLDSSLIIFFAYPFSSSGRNDQQWASTHLLKLKDLLDFKGSPYIIKIDDKYEMRIYTASIKNERENKL
ncbi:MAG TPA: hypothetical protein EYP28_05805 [Methanophagales archaeon]|nr:hypothetical protein [Methanophagales archaeon]